MSATVEKLDGRTWSEGESNSFTERYLVFGLDVAFTPFMEMAGLPGMGDEHDTFDGYVVKNRIFREGEKHEKNTVIVEVEYGFEESETMEGESGDEEIAIEDYGWEPTTEMHELVTAADGTKVLNSAGDPFDSVPQVQSFAPTFTKVMRTKVAHDDWLGMNCKVNDSEITVAGLNCGARTLLISVGMKRIFGDKAGWKYRWTIQMRRRTNLIRRTATANTEDIGWDVGIVQAGMRAIPAANEPPKRVSEVDEETGQRIEATSPVLLDLQGFKASDTDADKPYVTVFKTYAEDTVPDIFFSAPESGTDHEDEEEEEENT